MFPENRLHVSRKIFYDLVRFNREWNPVRFINALFEDWPDCFLFLNIPFSQTSPFMKKAVYEFGKGRNVVLLCPYLSTFTIFGRYYVRALGRVIACASMCFDGYETCIWKSMCFIFLIQPHYLDYIRSRNQVKRCK